MKQSATLISWVCRRMIPRCRSNVKGYLTLLFLFSGLILANQKTDAQCNSFGIDFKQAANRDNFQNYTTGEIHWIGSILQNSNSRYVEGMSTLQRIVMNNLTDCDCTHTLRIKMQSEKNGNHAYDFITSWDNAIQAANGVYGTGDWAIAPGFGLMPSSRSDPKLHECGPDLGACSETACNLVTNNGIGTGAGATFRDLPVVDGETNLIIPGDQNNTTNIIDVYESRYGERTVRVYASSFTGAEGDANNEVVFVGYGDSNPGDGGTTYIYYDIKWSSCSPNVVIEFGAHIAVGVDGLDTDPDDADGLGVGYFVGQGASDISGGPYHVIVEGFIGADGTTGSACEPNLGNLDNQLQGSQVLLIPSCNITGPSTACEGQTGLVYSSVNVNTQDPTYLWQIIGSNQTTPAMITSGNATTAGPITVSAGSVGSYTVALTITNGGATQDTDDDIARSCTFTTTVSGGPTIDCPDNTTVDACQTQEQINTAYQNWLQLVTPSGATHNGGTTGPDKCGGTKTVIFTATNTCGTATCSASFTVTADETPPAFTGSYVDVELGCNPADPAGSLGSASATDNCGATTITSVDGDISSDGCNRALTRTFTATDGCNNTATTSRTVRWISDLTPPEFTGDYDDVVLGCNPDNPEGSLGSASATDGCGGTTVTSSDGDIATDGCNRSITRTFTAIDGCDNTATISRTVRWISDLTPPEFTGDYDDVVLACNPDNPDGSLGTASATDACGGTTVTSSDGDVATDGCSRSRTRTFTATDDCGNTATISRTVRWISDLTPPVFTGNYDPVDLGCNPGGITFAGATATDNCGGTPTITSTDGDVQSDGCSRTATRTFTATDDCGNTATITRVVTYIVDVTPPEFTGSYDDVELGCNPADPAGSLGSASAIDACGETTITHSDGDVVSDGCNRSQTRTFTAVDGCDNTATTSRTVRWISDLTPPEFTGSYDDVELGCNPADPAGSLGSASATDVCGETTITHSDGDVVSDGCNRSQTRTFTAVDGCDNASTTSRTVRWISDLTPPEFTGSYDDVELGCNPADPAGSLGSASATDVCGETTITHSDGDVVSDGCNRSQTRTFTAVDGCDNASTTSRTVRWVVDVTGPLMTCAESYTAECGITDPVFTAPTATDGCGGTPTITIVGDDVVEGQCPTTYTRTWQAIDACGNTSTCSQTVTVPCCAANCTYTQGAYGTEGGKMCDGTNGGYSTEDFIELILGNLGGSLTVGCDGHSVTINAGDADCVIEKLPGGGPSGALPAGNHNICTLPASLLKGGRINNALLAQTITLGLNLGINGTLGDFGLQPNQWLVTADLEECGSTDVKECTFNCEPDPNNIGQYIWTVATTPYHVSDCKISQALYDALTTKNVSGLYALANSALCGNALPAGVTYSDITNAVDCINNAFDECRAFTAWVPGDRPTAESFCDLPSSTTPCPVLITRIGSQVTPEVVAETGLNVSAYPNPFRDRVNFRINSNVTGQATLEVYNMLGQKIQTVYRGHVMANRAQIIEYRVSSKNLNGGLIYILKQGGKQVTGKLLNLE